MRSENFTNQGLTFDRFDVQHMARAAVIDGLRHDNDKHLTYKEFAKRYINQRLIGNIERLHILLQEEKLSVARWREVEKLWNDLRPRGGENVWKPFNYEHLMEVGVVQEVSGGIEDIVERARKGVTWQVLALSEPLINDNIDYKKHIPRRNKVVLDSEQTIDSYATKKNMGLHLHWDGHVNDDLIGRLRSSRYSLNEAVVTGLEQKQGSSLKYPVISYTNYSTGDEARIFPLNLIEMVEIFAYFREYHGAAARFKLGDAEEKYPSIKVLIVPKRHPDEEFEVNQATLEYLADFHEGPLFHEPVWWLNFRAQCGCDYYKDQVNFTIAMGEKRYKPIVFDPHIGAAMLKIFDDLKQDARQYIPMPSTEMFGIADYARFNMFEIRQNNQRYPLREEAINILLMNAMIADPIGSISQPGEDPITPYVLKPLYSSF